MYVCLTLNYQFQSDNPLLRHFNADRLFPYSSEGGEGFSRKSRVSLRSTSLPLRWSILTIDALRMLMMVTIKTMTGVCVCMCVCADIHSGNVKTILQLFFNLSRYKQQQKLSASSTRRRRTQSGNRSDGGRTVQLNAAQHPDATTRSVPVERRAVVTSHSANVDVANGNVDMTSRCVTLHLN